MEQLVKITEYKLYSKGELVKVFQTKLQAIAYIINKNNAYVEYEIKKKVKYRVEIW